LIEFAITQAVSMHITVL